MTTLSTLTSHLSSLARETGAELSLHTQMEFTGSSVLLHWAPTGPRHDDVPRQATLHFGHIESESDVFFRAEVIDPARWAWAVDEGLTPEQADRYATHVVTDPVEVENYLMGRSYRFVRDGQVSA